LLGTFQFEQESWKKFKDALSQKDYVLIENSTNAFWFHDQLAPKVKACYVYNTNDIGSSGNKTDKIDAKKLARKLTSYVAMGENKEDLPLVYVPDAGIRELRGLFTTYRLYNKMKVQVKNRIHSILKQNGICIDRGKIDRKVFQCQIEEFKVEEVWKLQMRSAYRELQSLTKEQEGIKREIYSRGYARFEREVELLLGIRGFSPLTAIALMGDVVDVKRFKNAKHFCSYLRATPRVRSTNQVTHVGQVNRRSRPLTCTLLRQSILQLAQAGDHMAKFYVRVRVGKSTGKSRVALIRKVLVSAYHMLRKDEAYYWVEEE
ncbi:MAG TPA: transposase, partial [Terriglobales bacterium]|nr:transposase [Terriglobales bacterium]